MEPEPTTTERYYKWLEWQASARRRPVRAVFTPMVPQFPQEQNRAERVRQVVERMNNGSSDPNRRRT
jgi:hypothetical protein